MENLTAKHRRPQQNPYESSVPISCTSECRETVKDRRHLRRQLHRRRVDPALRGGRWRVFAERAPHDLEGFA